MTEYQWYLNQKLLEWIGYKIIVKSNIPTYAIMPDSNRAWKTEEDAWQSIDLFRDHNICKILKNKILQQPDILNYELHERPETEFLQEEDRIDVLFRSSPVEDRKCSVIHNWIGCGSSESEAIFYAAASYLGFHKLQELNE